MTQQEHGSVAMGDSAPEWRYEIKHGPEGEANYAWLYHRADMVAVMKTHDAVALMAALSRPVQEPVAVPDGWQIVPIKPTMEMVKDAAGDHEGEAWLPHSLWASMLSAAPHPATHGMREKIGAETPPDDQLAHKLYALIRDLSVNLQTRSKLQTQSAILAAHFTATDLLYPAAPADHVVPPHVRTFLGKVQGVCMGVAMSGRDHPNPDGVLMELFNEAQEILSPSVTASEGSTDE